MKSLAAALVVVSLVAGLAGCKKDHTFTDAGVTDAQQVDGNTVIDPPDARPPQPAYEIVGGAASVRGARFSADVQIGHGVDQAPTTGTAHGVEGNAAVKP